MTTPKSITEKGVHALTMIGGITSRLNEFQTSQKRWVEQAREEGCSWRMISVALGTSTQAAWEKFGCAAPRNSVQDTQLPLEINDDPGSPIPHKRGCGAHKTIAGYESCQWCGTRPSPGEK